MRSDATAGHRRCRGGSPRRRSVRARTFHSG
jgi:hypothetical protein